MVLGEREIDGVRRKAPSKSVLIIGSEALPFAKTGGLADVLGALPPALARLGWDVTLAIPKYRGVAAGALLERFRLTVGGYAAEVSLFEAPLDDGARALLVDVPDLYDRDELYGVGAERLSATTRAGSACSCAPPWSSPAARRSRLQSFTRTTGRPASRRSI